MLITDFDHIDIHCFHSVHVVLRKTEQLDHLMYPSNHMMEALGLRIKFL